MNFSENGTIYSDEIREGIDEIIRLLPGADARLFAALKKLEKASRAVDDPALHGQIHFWYASCYYLRGDYDRYAHYLRKAMEQLLRSSETEETARAINLFATNAQRLGCFDVAYNYYMLAESLLAYDKRSLLCAYVRSNIGDMLAEMEDYRAACTYIRKSLPVVRAHKDEPRNRLNYFLCELNLGIYSLFAGDNKGARDVLRRMEKERDTMPEYATYYYKIFLTQKALHEGARNLAKQLLDEVIDEIVTTSFFEPFMKDIHLLSRKLLAEAEWKKAGILIRAIEENDISTASVYSRLLMAQLKVEYYGKTGNRSGLRTAYLERHTLSVEHLQIRKELYGESAYLMRLIDAAEEEKQQAARENARIRTQAETDALTGLPNRYALNNELERMYEQAGKEQKTLCVGMADIDSFKTYNDTYGHRAGDKCLVQVAQALKDAAEKEGFFVARYGGDEFLLVAADRTDAFLQTFQEALQSKMPVAVSFGFVNRIPDEQFRLWDYLANADRKMYRIKRGEEGPYGY